MVSFAWFADEDVTVLPAYVERRARIDGREVPAPPWGFSHRRVMPRTRGDRVPQNSHKGREGKL